MLFLAKMIFLITMASAIAADSDIPQIPSSVTGMYVFLQSASGTGRGAGRQLSARITADEFRQRFSSFRELAKKERMKLIVTAQTADRVWIQDQIRYKGKYLVPTPYYNPGIDQTVDGAEVPLD